MMESKLEKAACFVKLPFIFSRENLPQIEIENLDAIKICKEQGVSYFVVPTMPFREIHQDEVKIKKELKLKGLPGVLPTDVDSLKGFNIFLRSWAYPTTFALKAIEAIGGRNELSLADHARALEWPNYVDSSFTQRDIGLMTGADIKKLAGRYAIDGNVFVKTADKKSYGHGIVASIDEVVEKAPHGIPYLSDERKMDTAKIEPATQVILSQPISFKADAKGNKEYRVWVFNKKVLAVRRYGNPEDTDVPGETALFTGRFVEAHADRLPAHYVVDVGLANKLGPVVVEINDIMSAGNLSPDIYRKILDAYTGKK